MVPFRVRCENVVIKKSAFEFQARKIEYKDPAEEEWALFQKEIVQELDTAQEIVTEDRQEATTGRQLEEIDDQMRAWSR